MVAQRGNKKGNDVEPVKQVFPEVAFLDLLLQVLVGGGDHTDIHGEVIARAYRGEALLLDDAQDLGLGAQAHVADFVQEERAAVGLLELAHLVFHGPGERAFHVAEQFAFDQFLGDGGAVDFHEGLLGAETEKMQGMRDQFLSGPAFAKNQDAAVGGSRQSQLLAQGLHGDAFANDAVFALQFLTQLAVLRGQSQLLDGVFQRQESLINGKGLFNEIKGAQFRGAHRGFNRSVAGNHDHDGRVLESLDFLQRLDAIHAGKPDIQQHHIAIVVRKKIQTGFAALHRVHNVSFILQDTRQRLANAWLIIDNQNGITRHFEFEL